jgi:hypothetical protein
VAVYAALLLLLLLLAAEVEGAMARGGEGEGESARGAEKAAKTSRVACGGVVLVRCWSAVVLGLEVEKRRRGMRREAVRREKRDD